VTPADPATDRGWDLALSRTRIATNSGTSGPGMGGARDAGAASLVSLTSAPNTDYTADAMVPNPGPPGSGSFSGNPVRNGWYDYDMTTHAVSPKDKAFLVRTADGGYVKLKITGYASSTYTLAWAYAGAGRTSF
jgi:hypothetical protein